MIYGNINAKETEAAYTPVIRKALDILRTTDVSEMHHGKYPIDGDKLILQINEITTGPKETKRPEVHTLWNIFMKKHWKVQSTSRHTPPNAQRWRWCWGPGWET